MARNSRLKPSASFIAAKGDLKDADKGDKNNFANIRSN